ncbi:MAG: HD-GYP domain-containing protein [Pseudomonadales bacterium]
MDSRFLSIRVADLQPGMFVSELDRPWLETPFLLQGFLITELDEIDVLNEYCDTVIINTIQSKLSSEYLRNIKRKSIGKTLEETFPTRKLKTYCDTISFDDELKVAQDVYTDYEHLSTRMYETFRTSNHLDVSAASNIINCLVDSIIRNPDACMLLHKMEKKGDYLYSRALGTSLWSAALARQIGLPPADIRTVTLGGLLCDIGKVRISNPILEKETSLSEEEFRLVQQHVLADETFKQQFPGLSAPLLDIIRCHHERHDGSGYPNGLCGEAIPVFARMVGLADCYDAMTHKRSYAGAVPPYQASKELYELRDIHFQGELVEEFIQATGIYPVGTLVELNTGEVGVVVAEYRTRRLRPKLLMVLDTHKAHVKQPYYLDLSQARSANGKNVIEIRKSLETGAYGLDVDDYYQ